MSAPPPRVPERASPEERRDLGFGSVLSGSTAPRLLNRDGSFTARREGLGIFDSIALYHHLVTISWPRFLGWVAVLYLGANMLFGLAYFALGPGSLEGATGSGLLARLAAAFFFSVHTLATIGYGNVSPASLGANLLVTLEALVGLLGFAVVAGVAFARVSRPVAGLVFSDLAVIAPYRGGRGLMFRVANARRTELFRVSANVTFSYRGPDGSRAFHQLDLERDSVVFLPTAWTVVHPIDESSPLSRLTVEDLRNSAPEMIAVLTATEEDFSQTVHARGSWAGNEIVAGARFANIHRRSKDGIITSVDVSRLSQIEPAPLPEVGPIRPLRVTS